MELIKNLNWRYATKKFDPNKKISAGDLERIKKAVQLSASSYGLQLYKVMIIEDRETREKLKQASWGQDQITDASQMFIFCNYSKVADRHIDEYMALKAKVQGIKAEQLKGYGDFIKEQVAAQSLTEQNHWTSRQTYLALGNLLAACAELKIDACPMEGFEPDKYDKILGLSEKGLTAAVVATVGYRSQEDQTQFDKKVRKPMELLFEI